VGSPPDYWYGVCNTDEKIPDGAYLDFQPCGEYNQPSTINLRVQEILLTASNLGVDNVTIDTVWTFAAQDDVTAVCGSMFVWSSTASWLPMIAEVGGGTYTEFYTGDRGEPLPSGFPMYECDDRFEDCGTPEVK
jgi:hypothetical protein